jgi:mannose-1-phosphate guanylyltransferase/mannose-6-phosphate isomerase
MSRRFLPKQFLPLVTERSLLQDTGLRLHGVRGAAAPVVVANAEHRFLVAEQLSAIGVRPRALVLEPVGRNTAPAIAAAALLLAKETPEAALLVLPSDHRIGDLRAFRRAVARAGTLAAKGALVTFGIEPEGPATGYGYIQAGEPIEGVKDAFRIRRFLEKPSARRARQMLARGGYLWNSGMFAFGARRYLEELGRHRPKILAAVERSLGSATRDLEFLRLEERSFAACPSESVDYAVMESTEAGAVIRSSLGWSDVGSWAALWEVGRKDAAGNVARGDAALHGARGCYVRADARHVSVLGARDLVVVEADDAVLVAARERAQEVKEVVERLKRANRTEHVSHSRVHRPWGYYETVDAGERFLVKRLMVKPGQALSLQRHAKRAEHWVVVSGAARVTREDEVFTLLENQSTFIPLGAKHRLENPGQKPLYLVEVQSGSYLGEADIERFEDRYGRA